MNDIGIPRQIDRYRDFLIMRMIIRLLVYGYFNNTRG